MQYHFFDSLERVWVDEVQHIRSFTHKQKVSTIG